MANILIIEDNPMCLEMASELLKKAGHSITKSESASEGIAQVKIVKPDLILMDLNLPDLDGLSATRILKEDTETVNIPVVAFTAMVMQQDRDKAFSSGCCGFISKPIEVSRFAGLVESFLYYKCEKIYIPATEKSAKLPNNLHDERIELLDNAPLVDLPHDEAEEPSGNKKLYRGHKILIVDDNPMNAEIIKETLEKMGQNTIIAYDGRQALDLVEKEKFDLILLDVMMPEISGFDVIKQLKAKPSTMNIPVIFISALDETDNIVKGFNLGSYEYITKPFKIDEFKARILSILKIKALQDDQETFMATLTHDLKTPVIAQMRALEMLLDEKFGKINEGQKNIIQETLNSNKYMFRMVNNLLSAYKYENNSVNITKSYFDINELIIDCYNQLKYLADDKKQNIYLRFQGESLDLNADIFEIKRVIVNLLSNAINYSEEGGEISISSKLEQDFIIVSFTDNGKGISMEDLPSLFNKYKSFAKKFRQIGTGLGLYLSRHIVESHGGTIYAESEEGKGSVFTIKLPIN